MKNIKIKNLFRQYGFLLLGVFAALMFAQTAAAQAPVADYQFQNNLNSSVAGAPALVNRIAPTQSCPSYCNNYVTDNVNGTSRTVLQFPEYNGLSLSNYSQLLTNPGVYTIEMTFKFTSDATHYYKRILGFREGQTNDDYALYLENNIPKFTPDVVIEPIPRTFTPNVYHQLVLTRAANGFVRCYVDGLLLFYFDDSDSHWAIFTGSTMRFFQDDSNSEENAAGMVSRIKIYNRALSTKFDYDTDSYLFSPRAADIGVFRPNGNWYVRSSINEGTTGTAFGTTGDKPAPADYDGDGITDICVFRPSNGAWYRLNSSNGAFSGIAFGQTGDIPVPGDFDGDGKADVSVFRPSNGTWYRYNSSNGSFFGAQFGQSGDKPQVGDFDGDGKSDLTVFRPSNGTWYVMRSATNSFYGAAFGASSDIPVVADYDGDGASDIAVWRPSNGTWYRYNSSTGAFVGIQFGANGDVPAPASYVGNRNADICVFRPSTGAWYLLSSSDNSFFAVSYGISSDIPVESYLNQ